MSADARCPSCGGLVAPDAEWCGQCFAKLGTGEPSPPAAPDLPSAPETGGEASKTGPVSGAPSASLATPGGGALEVTSGEATWDCPVCGERNALQASVCGVCETPFARLFERPTERPQVPPRTAAMWSLAFAGLGHWKSGHRADGVARIVLFAWTLGTVLVILLSLPDGGGFGRAGQLFVLYLAATASVYVESAVDAARVAGGRPPMVSSRTLLWWSAGLVLLSIVLATFVTLPAARG